ncbi:imelysin family protein [Meridianimarinicoccus aquatilis]|uniref:Signal peptidase n=1 Tax=Meridianimarinicoccus aquatilis TaxID=2552766 RepID=A0A4R6AW93_9RHOB|nr:imelysin family protein [Fluviibacterium aquatile]TDL87078.1 signal peptidase [Fluviibacterium aquatile]
MPRLTLTAICAICALPALADVDTALDDHILPGMDRLAAATATLADTSCDPAALRSAFADAALAWAAVSHLTLGPAEENGRARAILFWPDDRDATARGLRLLREQGADAWTPEALTRASIAARGLGALERQITEADAKPCAMTLALADDLAATAAAIRDGWQNGFADLMRTPGTPGNTRFLTEDEAAAALFTALLSGLEYTADARLGVPLGTFDKPQPRRAELRRSDLSVPMVIAALTSQRQLAASLADAPRTLAALDSAIRTAHALEDTSFAGVADVQGRFRVESLQNAIRSARTTAQEELGAALGVPAGFNSADGD